MRVPAVPLLVLVSLVAGCSSPPQEPVEPVADGTLQDAGSAPTTVDAAPDAPAQPASLFVSDCTNLGGVFPVPMDAARSSLPDGFEPVASSADPAGGATLYMVFLQCGTAFVDGAETGGLTLAYAELAVIPPDAYKLAGVDDYVVPLVKGVGSEEVRARLTSFGLGLVGPASVTEGLESGPGPQRLRMVVDGVTIDLTGQLSPQDASPLADSDFALIGVQDRVVRSVVRGHAAAGSAVQGSVTQQSMGLPVFEQARPTAVGFSASGFSLSLTLAFAPGAA